MNVSTSRDFIMHHVFANASLDVALCSAASFSDYSAHVCTGEESATFLGYFHTQETPCRHGFMIHLCCTCLWSRCPPRCCDFGADSHVGALIFLTHLRHGNRATMTLSSHMRDGCDKCSTPASDDLDEVKGAERSGWHQLYGYVRVHVSVRVHPAT
jgi:hypothetical protein